MTPDAAHTNQCDDSQLTHTQKKVSLANCPSFFFALANSRTIPIWYTSFLQSTSSIGHIPMANYFHIFNGVLRLVGVLFVSCPHHPQRDTHTHTHTHTVPFYCNCGGHSQLNVQRKNGTDALPFRRFACRNFFCCLL